MALLVDLFDYFHNATESTVLLRRRVSPATEGQSLRHTAPSNAEQTERLNPNRTTATSSPRKKIDIMVLPSSLMQQGHFQLWSDVQWCPLTSDWNRRSPFRLRTAVIPIAYLLAVPVSFDWQDCPEKCRTTCLAKKEQDRM
jgi:hypothetical protein